MGKVIDLHGTPVAQLKAQLEEKDREIAALKDELIQARNVNAQLQGIVELLKLQMHDVVGTLQGHQHSIASVINNIQGIKGKLPNV